MGAESSVQQKEPQSIEKDYVLLNANLKDPHFGQVKVLQNKNNSLDQICVLTKNINSEEKYQKDLKQYQLRKTLSHENFVRLISIKTNHESEFCSQFWNIHLYYQYYSNNLQNELFQRQSTGSYFTEPELIYILKSGIQFLFYLKQNNLTHGDIRPFNILIDSQGKIFFIENFTYANNIACYTLALMKTNQAGYLAPKLMDCLKTQQAKPKNVNLEKCDIFAFGMTLIELASLTEIKTCYDFKNYEILLEELQNLFLQKVQSNYSPEFSNFLQNMLIFQEEERPDLEFLLQDLDYIGQEMQQRDHIRLDNRQTMTIAPPQQYEAEAPQPKEGQERYQPKTMSVYGNLVVNDLFNDNPPPEPPKSLNPPYQPQENFSFQPEKHQYDLSDQKQPPFNPPVYSTTQSRFNPVMQNQPLVNMEDLRYKNHELDQRINQALAMSKDILNKYQNNPIPTDKGAMNEYKANLPPQEAERNPQSEFPKYSPQYIDQLIQKSQTAFKSYNPGENQFLNAQIKSPSIPRPEYQYDNILGSISSVGESNINSNAFQATSAYKPVKNSTIESYLSKEQQYIYTDRNKNDYLPENVGNKTGFQANKYEYQANRTEPQSNRSDFLGNKPEQMGNRPDYPSYRQEFQFNKPELPLTTNTHPDYLKYQVQSPEYKPNQFNSPTPQDQTIPKFPANEGNFNPADLELELQRTLEKSRQLQDMIRLRREQEQKQKDQY